ncbi:MAG: Hsp20/alpha crystallin family protein [Dehalococcoidia bacterium]
MPNLIVRDPFSDMRALMRRAFDDTFPGRWFPESDAWVRAPGRGRALSLDVYETDDGLTVEAPLPGFSKDDIDVTLEQGKLTIRAQKHDESEENKSENGRTYVLRERRHGVASRSLLIGEAYDPDSVSASLNDGLLTLQIKKAATVEPKRILIS